jgi:hypothetical protein
MSATRDDYVAAIHAASFAAASKVYEFANGFECREDYLPLEDLAAEVQGAAVRAAVDALREV